jgi:hypothetical protein
VRPERLLLAAGCLWLACTAQAAELGTLFFTPAERDQLDRMRRGEPEAPAGAIAGKPRITGFVRRSDGRNTVWINGMPLVVGGKNSEQLMDPAEVGATPGRETRIERSDKSRVKR